MPGWEPEIVVDADLARRLIGRFDDLRVESLELLSEGWDRTVWLVNAYWVFGFPRRAVVVPGLEREIAFLPRLAPLLPLAIPRPAFVGGPSDDYPWPFFGSAFLPGQELCDAALDDPARIGVAVELAGFLRRLHGSELAEALPAAALPLDSNRRADMAHRVPRTRDALAELGRLGLWHAPAGLAGLLDEAERLPSSTQLAVVHGDLHFRHLLVDRDRASAVIDWIDLSRSDPAIDLQLFWSFVPAAGRQAFLDAYGPVADERLLRARIVALSLCAQLALYGRDEGRQSVEREAIAGLERAVSS
jgi:aminoglycoside phosphotransferase (APT) family kinase protein